MASMAPMAPMAPTDLPFKMLTHIFSEYDLAIIRFINYRQDIMSVHRKVLDLKLCTLGARKAPRVRE